MWKETTKSEIENNYDFIKSDGEKQGVNSNTEAKQYTSRGRKKDETEHFCNGKDRIEKPKLPKKYSNFNPKLKGKIMILKLKHLY